MRRWLTLGLLLATPALAQVNDIGGASVTNAPGTAAVKATGSSASRTLADRASDVVNVADYGAKCDGSTNDAASFAAAIAAAAAKQGRVLVLNTGSACNLGSAMTVPSNVEIIGSGNPTLTATTVGNILNISGASNVAVRGLTLNGNYPTASAGSTIAVSASSRVTIEDVTVSASGSNAVYVNSGSAYVQVNRLHETNAHQHGVQIDASTDSAVTDSDLNGQAGFGIIISGASARIRVQGNKTRQSGLEMVGVQYKGSDIQVIGNYAENTGDNCYSFTGHNILAEGNIGIGCQGNGINVYGDRVTVTGNILRNNAQGNGGNAAWTSGIMISQGFGGMAQHNVVSGNVLDDDQASPTQKYGVEIMAPQYSAWATGVAVTSGAYRYNGLNLYIAQGAGTTGASAPTCTSGACSDGTVTWAYVSTFDTSTLPDYNMTSNNNVLRYVTAPYLDAGTASHNSGLRCFAFQSVSGSTPTNNACSNNGAAAFGQFNTASGTGAFVSGSTSQATNTATAAFGTGTWASGPYSFVAGRFSYDRGDTGAQAFASNQFSTKGDAQIRQVQMMASLSSTGATRLTTGAASVSATSGLAIPTNAAFGTAVRAVCTDTTNRANFAAWTLKEGSLTRGSGTPAYAGAASAGVAPDYSGGAGNAGGGATLTIGADTTYNVLSVSVTWPDSNAVHCVADVRSVEVQ